MAIFDGRYYWDGTKDGDLEPVAWYPGSYDVKIVALEGEGNVTPMWLTLCLFARTGEGVSISANPEKFAKRICAEFFLDLERVLWVEDLLSSADPYQVVTFTCSGKMGRERFYQVTRRQATAAEKRLIGKALGSIETGRRHGWQTG